MAAVNNRTQNKQICDVFYSFFRAGCACRRGKEYDEVEMISGES